MRFTKRQLKFAKDQLSEDTVNRLVALNSKLDGHDFPSRLRRYVKHCTTDDAFDENNQRTNTLDEKIGGLAQEATSSPDLLGPELPWLVCQDSSAAFCFAYRIGRLDPARDFLPVLLKAQEEAGKDAAPTFLSGYLFSIYEASPATWERVMLTVADEASIKGRFVNFVFGSGMSDAVARKVLELCQRGGSDVNCLKHVWFRERLRQVEESIFLELIDLQLADHRAEVADNALHMFYAYYLGIGTEKEFPEESTFRVLTCPALFEESLPDSAIYYWSMLATKFVARFPRRTWEFFEAILQSGTKRWSLLSDLDTTQDQILTGILKSNPERGWQCITLVYSRAEDKTRYAIQHWLAEGGHRLHGLEAPGPIQFVPRDQILAWVDQDAEEHGHWLVAALPKTVDDSPGGRLTRDFIVKYSRKRFCSNSLLSHFCSRSWCGTASNHYRALRDEARNG